MKSALVIASLCLAGMAPPAWGALNLSVTSLEGGNALRFDQVLSGFENKKEARIRVTSTDGKRYQVFQRVTEPIVNEQGENMNLQSLQTQTLANSNSSGTLYLENTGHLSFSDQLIYTSGQSGESDSFLVGYSLDPRFITGSGKFTGSLVYTARAVGDPQGDEAVLNIVLNNPSAWKSSVKGGRVPTQISINGTDTTPDTADFADFSFSGNTGQAVRVYQQIEVPLQNDSGQPLDADVLELDPSGDTDGLRISGPTPLGGSRSLLYTGNKETDHFRIYYLVNASKIPQQDAGIYTGRIKYIIETDQQHQEFTLDIRCRITPEFSLTVTPPPDGFNFSRVLPGNPPQEKEFVVTVYSNLHKPYQVLQSFQMPMANKQGKEFDKKYFTMKVDIPQGQSGQTDFNDFMPVQTGEYPIFSSDGRGSTSSFRVVYHLQGYPQMSAGTFVAPIKFSLNQK